MTEGFFKEKEELEEFFKNLGIEYRFSCYHEKRAEGCDLLGDYMEQIQDDWQKAYRVYKDNCDNNNWARSCTKAGIYNFKGSGCPVDMKTAYTFFAKACENNDTEGCLYAGQMVSGTDERIRKEVKPDVKKGLQMLEKGCDFKKPESGECCFIASSFYINGKAGCEKNMKKAFELSVKGCDLDNMMACTNLAQMYLRGEGTKQNLELGNKIKKKVLDVQEEIKKARTHEMQRH